LTPEELHAAGLPLGSSGSCQLVAECSLGTTRETIRETGGNHWRRTLPLPPSHHAKHMEAGIARTTK